ncbi:MAG: transporter substrate-binding domain-containing protein [Bauldia sp.]|nr:transporter substrate-binding domain-containing protein [Bauldia sp.]
MVRLPIVLFGVVASTAGVLAQPVLDIPERFLRNPRNPSDSSIAFCVNPTSALYEFEKDLAEELAATLLLIPEVFEIAIYQPPLRYDFRLPLLEQEIYWYLLQRCDAFMGFTAAADYPDYLTVSPIYLETNSVLAISPRFARLEDIPPDVAVGARILSLAGSSLGAYIRGLPAARQWKLNLYQNHETVMDRLMDGTVGAILIWEPGLAQYLRDHPDAPETRIVRSLPFQVSPTQFVLALRAENDYLNYQLAQAIEAVVRNGTIDRLMAEHSLTLD